MNTPTDTSGDEAGNAIEGRASAGATLSAAREARGLSREQVAEQLKYLPRQIEALETGDHAHLPGGVFTRGMIRAYAHLLGIDAEALLASQDAPAAPAASTRVTAPSERIRLSAPSLGWGAKLAIGAVLLFGLVTLIYQILSKPAPPTADAPEATLPEPAAAMPLPPSVSVPASERLPTDPVDVEEPSTPMPAVPVDADEAAATPVPEAPDAASAATASAPLPETSPPAGAARVITLAFDGDAWVEVMDGQGKTLMSQLNRAGSKQRITGEPPFSLTVGNAAQVRMTYNGRAFDLRPHINVTVARITLE